MMIEIKVPTLGESVTTATVARWIKKAGDRVSADEPVVELETDKVSVEVPSPAAGTLRTLQVQEGAEVEVGAVLALLEGGSVPASVRSASVAPGSAANPSAGVNPPPRPSGPVPRPATPPSDLETASSKA